MDFVFIYIRSNDIIEWPHPSFWRLCCIRNSKYRASGILTDCPQISFSHFRTPKLYHRTRSFTYYWEVWPFLLEFAYSSGYRIPLFTPASSLRKNGSLLWSASEMTKEVQKISILRRSRWVGVWLSSITLLSILGLGSCD